MCVQAIPEAPGVNLYARMENVPREQHKEGTQPFFVFFFLLGIRVRIIFNLGARVVQRKGPVYCLVPCRVPSWLIGVHPTSVCLCVLECVCVCVSWLLSPVRLPTLDWTPVALAVKGHSTWVDILSPTSATNLPEPSHSKAPLWSRQQHCDCFL